MRRASLAFVPLVLLIGCSERPNEIEPGVIVNEAPAIILDGGGPVAVAPEGETLCPAGDCNYQTQEGCTADQACRPSIRAGGTLEPSCQEALSGTAGDACTEWTDCAPGYLCAGGSCRRLCCGGDWSVCAPDEGCFQQLLIQVGDAGVPADVSLCSPVDTCDVFNPDACSHLPNGGCVIVDPRGKVACLANAIGELGDACSTTQRCSTGMTCAAGKCRRLCRLEAGAEPSCPRDEGRCIHFNRDPAGVGECMPTQP